MRHLFTHALAALFGALALGLVSLGYATPTRNSRDTLVWQDSVYKLCYALKEVQHTIEPDTYLIHHIRRCGVNGRVYTRGG